MKHVKLFKQYVNEKIEYSSSTVNGKKIESSWSGSANSLKDFIKLIKEIPETLKSIRVQTGTSTFNPESTDIDGPFNSSKINKIIKLVKDTDKAFGKQDENIHTYLLSSYYGSGGKNHNSDPAYISYRTERSDKFGKAMSSGKHGSLD
jgi:hypothetical protein|tara:strand:- start:48 stop:491 length:444 start_codon:yes stop_codon:yes gene_type:complete